MKKVLSLLLCIVLCISLIACGKASESPAPDPAAQTEAAAPAVEDKTIIGFLIPTQSAEIFVTWEEDIKGLIEPKGWELMTVSYENDVAKEISAVENMVSSGVDLIFAMVQDSAGDDAFRQAQQAGVLIYECGIETEVYDLSQATDNYSIGKGIGEMAANYVNENLNGEAKVAVFTTLQNPTITPRGDGAKEKFEELCPNSEIVEVVDVGSGDAGSGTAATETLLAKYPDLDAIMCYGDAFALEAAEAAKAAGKTPDSFAVFGCDGTAEAVKQISEGGIMKGSASFGDFLAESVEYMERLLNGETFPEPLSYSHVLITKDNVADFIG